MNADSPLQQHFDSLSLPSLSLEILLDPDLPLPTRTPQLEALSDAISRLWPHFLEIAQSEEVFAILPIDIAKQDLAVEMTWTGNMLMQTLNRDYRDKDQPTDVLTFTLVADAEDPGPWLSLPEVQLGSIFISLDWAEAAVQDHPDWSVERYLMERFVHGLLHLLGQHHDEMADFERVVGIQQQVLDAAFGPGASTV